MEGQGAPRTACYHQINLDADGGPCFSNMSGPDWTNIIDWMWQNTCDDFVKQVNNIKKGGIPTPVFLTKQNIRTVHHLHPSFSLLLNHRLPRKYLISYLVWWQQQGGVAVVLIKL